MHVKDALGLHDLAFLLANPNNDIHARILAAGDANKVLAKHTETKVLDPIALQNFRQRLTELTQEKMHAGEIGNEEQYQILEQEEDFILEELARTTGLSGKQRSFTTEDERARKSITARIRASIKRIEALHPELGEYLSQTISTGIFCCYNQSKATNWLVK